MPARPHGGVASPQPRARGSHLPFPFSCTLADSFLADSAPQDQRVRAPIDTAQAPLAIFFTREDIPSSLPTPPPAFEDASYTMRGSVDTPPSAPADLKRVAPAPTASGTANTLLTAGDTESIDSRTSPSARAIKACEPVSSAAHTVCGISRPKCNSPGGVLDDFLLADTIAAVPCVYIPVSAPAPPTASCWRMRPHLLAACIWFWAIYLAWIATRWAAAQPTVAPLRALCPIVFHPTSIPSTSTTLAATETALRHLSPAGQRQPWRIQSHCHQCHGSHVELWVAASGSRFYEWPVKKLFVIVS